MILKHVCSVKMLDSRHLIEVFHRINRHRDRPWLCSSSCWLNPLTLSHPLICDLPVVQDQILHQLFRAGHSCSVLWDSKSLWPACIRGRGTADLNFSWWYASIDIKWLNDDDQGMLLPITFISDACLKALFIQHNSRSEGLIKRIVGMSRISGNTLSIHLQHYQMTLGLFLIISWDMWH